MQNNQAIFESLFSRNFSDKDNHDFLQELTNEHPYFSPAQFYLLQQTASGTDTFGKQAVKTNILFNNPHWLHFQLQQTGSFAATEKNISLAENKTLEPAIEIIELPDIVFNDEEQDIVGADKLTDIIVPDELQDIVPPDEKPDMVVADELPDNTDEAEEADMETEIEPMRIELKMPAEKTNLNEALLFEPMHVVDYFASQGIKLTDDVQTADKLGKQLKSFTEWLKTMKKVHVDNEMELSVATDTSINILAQNSNTETEVLTESMAEVFAKQGKMGKASEVYQKLSLLNPAKSPYFAAKIENLKGI